jgi:hypothetical protein
VHVAINAKRIVLHARFFEPKTNGREFYLHCLHTGDGRLLTCDGRVALAGDKTQHINQSLDMTTIVATGQRNLSTKRDQRFADSAKLIRDLLARRITLDLRALVGGALAARCGRRRRSLGHLPTPRWDSGWLFIKPSRDALQAGVARTPLTIDNSSLDAHASASGFLGSAAIDVGADLGLPGGYDFDAAAAHIDIAITSERIVVDVLLIGVARDVAHRPPPCPRRASSMRTPSIGTGNT